MLQQDPQKQFDKKIDEQVEEKEEEYRDYPYRWMVVILFCLPNMMNAIEWITFSSISSQIEKAYDQSQFMVTMTSLVWLFLYIIINFPSNYILAEKGLKIGIFIGMIFTIVGAWLRLLINYDFGWAIFGQICGGIGQPFILNAPTQLAAVWFKPKQRQVATSILSLINTIGVGIGFLFPSFFVETSYSSETRNEVYDLMLYQAIVISVCCIPTFIFFREKPPTPPSQMFLPQKCLVNYFALQNILPSKDILHSANSQKISFQESLPILFKNKNFLYLYISFGCILGNFNSIATLINFYLEQFGFTSDDTSYFGLVFIISGLIGSAVMTSIVEKNHQYKNVIIITCILSILSYAFQMGIMDLESFGLSIASFFIFGFFATPLIPLSLEFACEITYPVPETISSGLIFKSGQLFGVIQIIISSVGIILDNQDSVFISQGIGLVFQIVGFIFFLFIKEDLKRKKDENKQIEQKLQSLKNLDNPHTQTQVYQTELILIQ